MMADLRFALRGLRRSPLFSIVAILSLALGIGANTAIFTLLDQILLRHLPVRAPEELVMLFQRGSHMGSNMGSRMHSYPIYQDYQQRAEPLVEVIARRLVPASVSVDNRTERVEAELVSGNYFSMLGVQPAVGRVFSSQEDDQVFRGHPVVVLGYDYWTTRFASDPGVVGRKILVNNHPMTVVGVSARGLCRRRSGAVAAAARAHSHGAGHAARLGLAGAREPARPLGPGLRAIEAGVHRRIGGRASAGTLPPDPPARDDAAGGEGVVRVFPRSVHEGHAARRERVGRLLGTPQRLLDRAGRVDVHGRPGAPDRLRERREPADCAWLHAAEGNRGAPVARRLARPARPAAPRREPRAVGRGRRARRLPVAGAHARTAVARAVGGPTAADPAGARSAHSRLRDRTDRS